MTFFLSTVVCVCVCFFQGTVDPNVASEPCWTSPGGRLYPRMEETTSCCCRDDDDQLVDTRDDEEFVESLLVQVVEDLPLLSGISIDTQRIYMAGHGDGCTLAMSFAALHSDLVAAVACHAGAVVTPVSQDSYQPTPVWRVHGTDDPIVPYRGKRNDDKVVLLGAMQGNDYWGETNGCKTFESDNVVRRNLNQIRVERYTDCNGGATVELVSILGGGHKPYLEMWDVPAATTFDTTAMAWEFCTAHSLDEVPARFGGSTMLQQEPQEPINGGFPTPVPTPEFRTNCDFGPDALNDVIPGVEIPRTCIPTLTGQRCYYTYVPDCASGQSPIVLDVHGYNNCPRRMARTSGWLEQATENCFVLVWPTVSIQKKRTTLGTQWCAHTPIFSFNHTQGNIDTSITQNSCWSTPAGLESGPDGQPTVPCCCSVQPEVTEDTDFLRRVISDVVQELPGRTEGSVSIDTKRIYLGGHSNGCMLDMAMAAQHSDLIAAVCCHSGSVLTEIAPNYVATPVWRIHGSIDFTVPYGGAFSEERNVQVFTGAVEGSEYWANANNCQESETRDFRRNLNFGTIHSYTNCTDGANVELVTITGGGHNPYRKLLDIPLPTTFDTTALAWDFCSSYSSVEEPFIEGVTRTPSAAPIVTPTAVPTTNQPQRPSLCFSGDNLVPVRDQRQEVLMRDLRVGDEVLVVGGQYEKIYAFGHYHTTLPADFLRIFTEHQERPLELSEDHMVFVEGSPLKAVPALSLRVGDGVMLGNGTVTTVVAIDTTSTTTKGRRGVFAPFTASGTIVVNGLLASNYVSFQPTGYWRIGGIVTPLSHQWLAHTYVSFHRRFLSSEPKTETYTETGVAAWLENPLRLTQWLFGQSSMIMR